MAKHDVVEADDPSSKLKALAQLLVASWNQGDAQGFAGLFTDEAEYLTGAADAVRGRQAISQLVRATPPIQVCVLGEPSVECSASRGQLSFAWSTVTGAAHTRSGRISCTCIRHESGWLIQALQNVEDGSVAESRGSPTKS